MHGKRPLVRTPPLFSNDVYSLRPINAGAITIPSTVVNKYNKSRSTARYERDSDTPNIRAYDDIVFTWPRDRRHANTLSCTTLYYAEYTFCLGVLNNVFHNLSYVNARVVSTRSSATHVPAAVITRLDARLHTCSTTNITDRYPNKYDYYVRVERDFFQTVFHRKHIERTACVAIKHDIYANTFLCTQFCLSHCFSISITSRGFF